MAELTLIVPSAVGDVLAPSRPLGRLRRFARVLDVAESLQSLVSSAGGPQRDGKERTLGSVAQRGVQLAVVEESDEAVLVKIEESEARVAPERMCLRRGSAGLRR